MRRSGVFAGVAALGFVSWSQVFETCPSMPPGAVASAISRTTGIAASAAQQQRGRRAAWPRGEAGRSAPRKPATRPTREQQHEHQQQQRAELVAGVGAHLDRQRARSSGRSS